MVQYAAAFHHATGTDNHSRFVQGVKFFGLLHIFGKTKGIKTKRIGMIVV